MILPQSSANIKACSVCKQRKLICEFYKNPAGKYGVSHRCKECEKAYQRAYRKAHSEQKRAYNQRYRSENHETLLAADRRRYQEHREEMTLRQREYRAAHHDEILMKDRERSKTPERMASNRQRNITEKRRSYYQSRYKKDNYIRASHRYAISAKGKAASARGTHNFRWKNISRVNDLTAEQWQIIVSGQGNLCANPNCRQEFDSAHSPQRDCIIPASKGGGLTFNNVQALCATCNASKKDTVIDYRITSGD